MMCQIFNNSGIHSCIYEQLSSLDYNLDEAGEGGAPQKHCCTNSCLVKTFDLLIGLAESLQVYIMSLFNLFQTQIKPNKTLNLN